MSCCVNCVLAKTFLLFYAFFYSLTPQQSFLTGFVLLDVIPPSEPDPGLELDQVCKPKSHLM